MKPVVKLLVICFSIVISGCGEKKEEKKKDEFEVVRKKVETVQEDDSNTIALASNDLMAYDKNELAVEAGKEVTLTLRHTGKMDKMVMGHNFVLLKLGTDMGSFAAEAAVARENDYIPEGTDAVIVHTKMIGGGETTTITFEAPEPGTYDFMCSFPGHYGVMQGKFIVKETSS